MKTLIQIFIFIGFFNALWAMGSRNDASNCYYADNNVDGINDLFRDVNGDGINDIDSTIVIPNIEFIDEDNNNINDIFCDYDGDGVNDVYTQSKKIPVIDIDNNNYNDITGSYYKKGNYCGYKYGIIIEEYSMTIDSFIDNNHDFMDDNYRKHHYDKMYDRFIDDDNDGVCDNRKKKLRIKGKK